MATTLLQSLSRRMGLLHPLVPRWQKFGHRAYHKHSPSGCVPTGKLPDGWRWLRERATERPQLALPSCPPADLNGFLLQMEANIADFAAELGCSEVEQQFRQLAMDRWGRVLAQHGGDDRTIRHRHRAVPTSKLVFTPMQTRCTEHPVLEQQHRPVARPDLQPTAGRRHRCRDVCSHGAG